MDTNSLPASSHILVSKESVQDLQVNSGSSIIDDSPKVPPRGTKTAFINLIKSLNLLDKYPQKLQLTDALMIRLELLNTNDVPNDIHVLPYLILLKIMMFNDYRPLCKIMSKNIEQFKVHPIDVLLALLHCCNNILRQDLLSRLHTCKLAIPFLLPDPNNKTVTFLLWAMRSIICEWKCKIGRNIASKECRMVYNKGPIISFLRVGSTKSPKDFSKSHMLNMVIGEEKYFFHWNCPGGGFRRQFVNGMVELSCYFPSGKEIDSFSDAVIFLNLRGETRDYTIQLDFIRKVSFMTFLVLLEEKLDDSVLNLTQQLTTLPGGLVIIFPDYDYMCTLKNSNILLKIISEKKVTPLNIKDENEDEIKSQIQKVISEKISAANPSQFLAISECATIAQKCGIKVDEDNANCKEGHALAYSMIEILNSVEAIDAKAKMLPLQGSDLWHKWAEHDKESFQKRKKGNGTVAYFNQSLDQKKKEIRQKQWYHTGRLNPLMKKFTNSLRTSNTSARAYTLIWLKLLLDDRSRKILPGMRTEYEQIRSELQKAKEEGHSETSTVVKNLINQLKRQNKSLIEGSLGLEHLFREVGQMYEAVKDYSNRQHTVDCYPKIMVEILNQGYPVELMDGDASHVPMTWISAILTQLKEIHKRKKLLVISVLGIQSTGKSTLLNTMFGLQFNVSAGRCTRGAFMQLLPVKSISGLSQKSMCDYVLIIDTEGLRAPELSSTESFLHDNELATFVIGLADVAIINIYGEAPGDLNDILQTAVHAFIRMRNVSVNLSCHFVHQNVTALSVDSKIKFGQQTFQDKLNEMTKFAAIAEHCESKYSSFKDVIKFDGTKDVTYFPGLWKGDPPMAPVNSGYSDKALQLKSTLMTLADAKTMKESTFSNFHLLVTKLWNAVCSENYIFSFKNTQEVVAYNELDAAFSQWSWTLHRKMLEWRHQTGNTINNCPSTQVSATATACHKKADNMLQETYIKLHKELTDLFENSEHSGTLAQWRARYTTRLQHLKDDCKLEAKKQCDLLKFNREGHLKLEDIQKHHRKQLLQQIQQLVARAKQKNTTLTQFELKKKFDEKWQCWIKEFSIEEYQSMYTSNEEIEIEIADVLQELLTKHDSILMSKLTISLSERGRHGLHITIDPKKHLTKFLDSSGEQPSTNHSVVNKVTNFFGLSKDNSKKEQDIAGKHAQKSSDDFFVKAKDAFRKIKKDFHNFDRSYAYDLLKEFVDNINSYNKTQSYIFTPEYIVDMALAFASYMTAEFIKLMNEVRMTHDPMASFKRLRETYLNTFLDQYKDISSDHTAARNLCQLLIVAIEAAVVEDLPTEIVDHIKGCDPNFGNKRYFKVKVLKDLAAKEDFKLFKAYFVDIKSSFESWAKQYVEEFCVLSEKENHTTLARSIVHNLIIKIDAAVKDLNINIPIKQWLQNFHQKLNESLTIDLSEMQDLIGATHVGNSSEYFVNTLCEQLTQVEEIVMKIIVDPSSKFSNISNWGNSPHLTICDNLIGCSEQCPFCGEQCELIDANHVACGKDHFINIHRPQCLGRFIWTDSNKLVLDLCTYSVESEYNFRNKDTNYEWVPYKDYRNIYKNWCISNESPTESPKYWQWFISNFLDEIIEWVGAEPTSIDHLNWGAVSPTDAVDSLSEVYKIT